MKKKTGFPKGRAILCGVLAILIIAANIAVNYFSGYLDNMYTVYEAEGGGVDDVSYEDAVAHGNDVSKRILQEGSVLLKNEGDILPLSADIEKVNLFGWRSGKMVFGGAGSGFVDDADAVSLQTALAEKNIEVNTELLDLYTDYSNTANASGVGETDFNITEVPVEQYTEEIIANAKEFSDVAIITVSRMGGEGNDLPTDMAEFGGESGRHYLELSQNEEDMIQLVTDNFDKVILLVNTSHAMELGFTEEYGIDALLWIGCPGTNGLRGVADVLTGEVNPSGRMVDTYAYDATSAPSFVNFGDFSYSNASDLYYVNYMEGIYVGYKYYETRGYTDGEEWYEGQVQYPFGYGLSYTEFEQHITSFVNDGSNIVVTVEVRNTGDVPGKDVVQLYYTPPYTPGGVEKAYVNLVGFEKTDLLQPDESCTVTISFALEDMASYDYLDNAAYVLEAGDYEIKLMKNAHDMIESETVSVPSTIVYTGDNKRSTDLVAATNQFDDIGVNFTEGHTYLSRNDWEGTWPDAANAVDTIPEDVLADVRAGFSDVYDLNGEEMLEDYADEPIITDHRLTEDEIASVKSELREVLSSDQESIAELDEVEGVTSTEDGSYSALQEQYIKLQNGTLVFGLMNNFDYDSPVWDLLLSQMSVEEMSDLISMAGYRTAPVESIEKSVTMDIDGPAGMQPFLDFSIDIQPGVGYPTEVTIASTWNLDLVKEMAVCVGEFANSQNVSGWYAPAMNAHRSPFAGRNFEYYSEDSYLTGKFGAAAVQGARSQGIWVYIKHFALCDQELHRDENGLFTFSNEQAVREIYLKPFEISMKEGEATGVMSSFNRVGYTWCGASYPLCTTVLRDEWGFNGAVITDFYMNWGSTYVNARAGVLAGNDLYLNPFQHEALTADMISSDDQLAQAAKQSCKNILYMTSRGVLVTFTVASSWRPLWIGGNVVAGIIFAASIVWLVLGIKKRKEK